MHVHTCMSSRPNNTSRFDEKPTSYIYPVDIPDHSPIAATLIVTFLSTVEQSFRRFFKGSVAITAAVIVTAGGPNLALEIAKAQWSTFDESWKQQTGEDCDGQRSYLHLID